MLVLTEETVAVSILAGTFAWLCCLPLAMKGSGVLKRGVLESRLAGNSRRRRPDGNVFSDSLSLRQRISSTPMVITLLGLVVTIVLRSPSVVIAAVCLTLWLKLSDDNRRRDLLQTLPESLEQLATMLESGLSVHQAIQLMSDESQGPVSELFLVIQGAVNVGNSMEEASRVVEQRLGSPDISLFCAALAINSRAGGSLAPLVQRVAAAIRERRKVADELRVETLQARMSGRIVGFLPLAALVTLWLVNPSFVAPLLNTSAGNAVLSVSVAANLGGLLIIRFIMRTVETSYG